MKTSQQDLEGNAKGLSHNQSVRRKATLISIVSLSVCVGIACALSMGCLIVKSMFIQMEIESWSRLCANSMARMDSEDGVANRYREIPSHLNRDILSDYAPSLLLRSSEKAAADDMAYHVKIYHEEMLKRTR